MADHNELGNQGEELAIQFLRKKGCKILHKNYRLRHMEADVICQDKDELVFVEVKTRTRFEHADPDDVITNKKMKHLIDIAEDYIMTNNWENETRFDVVIVVMNNPADIEHIEGAFTPNY